MQGTHYPVVAPTDLHLLFQHFVRTVAQWLRPWQNTNSCTVYLRSMRRSCRVHVHRLHTRRHPGELGLTTINAKLVSLLVFLSLFLGVAGLYLPPSSLSLACFFLGSLCLLLFCVSLALSFAVASYSPSHALVYLFCFATSFSPLLSCAFKLPPHSI